MSWILGSIDPHIILNLRSFKNARDVWNHLKWLYTQNNVAKRFQLELEMSNFSQGALSVEEFYSGFCNLWTEYTDTVSTSIPTRSLADIQAVHEASMRAQFLMKLRPEFEFKRANLMNRDSVPPLDMYLGEIFREEQRLMTQTAMEQATPALVAYAAQAKTKGRDLSTTQCYSCKGYGHIAANCSKKTCNCCKMQGHIIKDCPIHPPRCQETAYSAAVEASSAASSTLATSSHVPASTSQNPTSITPEMVQQMIKSALSAFGILGKTKSASKPWYFDFGATNHMTSASHSLVNVSQYAGPLKIHTAIR
ncbi:hypothetical protein CIPAW_01G307800 [Carya illinoinensis]|uniref:CCHC-type domain-containing protein n=1 Tax=Carya illinoinensis TaxID=32201 RepID=A0A8T1RTJ1_CARIL|nr:hypothetical protein CIPAW_01G307800 [Carya illinoinensis]